MEFDPKDIQLDQNVYYDCEQNVFLFLTNLTRFNGEYSHMTSHYKGVMLDGMNIIHGKTISGATDNLRKVNQDYYKLLYGQ